MICYWNETNKHWQAKLYSLSKPLVFWTHTTGVPRECRRQNTEPGALNSAMDRKGGGQKIIKKAHGCQTHKQLSTVLNLHLDLECGDRPQPGSESRLLVSVRSSLRKVSISLPCGSDGKESAYNTEDPGLIPGLERSPGACNGYPLQYSGLASSMDREAWWTTVHGGAKSQTQLID